MARQPELLAKLRTYVETLDARKYLSTEMRQNLKTLEYWHSAFLDFKDSASPEIPGVVVKFVVGAAGLTVSLVPEKCQRVLSIERISVGKYKITTDLTFTDVNFITTYVQLSTGSPGALNLVLREFNTSQKTITAEYLDGSFAATDIVQDSIVGIKIYLTR